MTSRVRTVGIVAVGVLLGMGLFSLTKGARPGDPAATVAPPVGMVYVPGGTTRIGDARVPAEAPEFDARVRPFFMDANLVTVREFRRFVEATGYATTADREGGAVY